MSDPGPDTSGKSESNTGPQSGLSQPVSNKTNSTGQNEEGIDVIGDSSYVDSQLDEELNYSKIEPQPQPKKPKSSKAKSKLGGLKTKFEHNRIKNAKHIKLKVQKDKKLTENFEKRKANETISYVKRAATDDNDLIPPGLGNHDQKQMNKFLNVDFLDAFSEPNPKYHSLDCVLTLSYHIFEHTRVWAYKAATVVFGLPIALLGGLLFALFAFMNIWIIRPILVLCRMIIYQVIWIWPMIVMYILRPLFYAGGACFSSIRLHRSEGAPIHEIWERHVQRV